MLRFLPLVLLLVGCGAQENSLTKSAVEASAPSDTDSVAEVDLTRLVYVDVHPAILIDDDNEFRVLPQTVGPFSPESGLNVGSIQLETPTSIDGFVTGDVVTPQAAGADLPFSYGPIAADIIVIHNTRSVQNYLATTDTDGFFSSLLVADGYDIFVVPQNPMVPVASHREAIDSGGATVDFEIDQGAAIWGRVLYPSLPSSDPFRVHLVDGNGIRSATALTDEDGFYMIRVLPEEGPFTVVCEGRDDGRDPILTSVPVDPNEELTDDSGLDNAFLGAQVDFDYPTYRLAIASGRVKDENDESVGDVEVRFTATRLTGYDSMDAALSITRVTDNAGNFDVSLPAGDYDVEFMPQGAKSPKLSQASVNGNSPLGTINLEPLTAVTGKVFDSSNSKLGSAQVSCAESGFGERVWKTFADDNGNYALDLPTTDIICTITPPDTRTSALTRTEINGANLGNNLDLTTSPGTTARGSVDLAGEPEAFAVVEFRDGLGRLLGSTVTDEEGAFRIQLDLPPVSEDSSTTN